MFESNQNRRGHPKQVRLLVLAGYAMGIGVALVVVLAYPGDTDPKARAVGLGVLMLGAVLLAGASARDEGRFVAGAGRAACVLSLGVAATFALGVVGPLIAFALVPTSAGMFARNWTGTTRVAGAGAWLLGFAMVVLSVWFAGRADERPVEGLASAGLFVLAGFLLRQIRQVSKTTKP